MLTIILDTFLKTFPAISAKICRHLVFAWGPPLVRSVHMETAHGCCCTPPSASRGPRPVSAPGPEVKVAPCTSCSSCRSCSFCTGGVARRGGGWQWSRLGSAVMLQCELQTATGDVTTERCHLVCIVLSTIKIDWNTSGEFNSKSSVQSSKAKG